MKKLTSLIAVVALISAFATSCKKDKGSSVSTEAATYKNAEARISQLRINVATFKAQHSSMKTTVSKGTIKVAGADCAGAAPGASWGWKIGGVLGNPFLGGAIGCLVGAIASSAYTAWLNDVIPFNPPAPTWGNSYTNSYEQTGYYHNQACMAIFANNTNLPTDAKSFADQVYSQICTYLANIYSVDINVIEQNAPLSSVESYLENYDANATVNQNMQLIGQFNSDAAVLSYSSAFQTDFLSCDPDDYTDIYGFCDAYTAEANADESLTQNESIAVLNIFQIAKYSYALWSNN